jgi:hypothetical protein
METEAGNQKKQAPNKVIQPILLGLLLLGISSAVFLPNIYHSNWRFNRGHVSIIGNYFDRLKSEGWEVDSTTPRTVSYRYEGNSMGVVREKETLIWKARPDSTQQWTEYIWELYPVNKTTFDLLSSQSIPTDNWWMRGVEVNTFGVSATGSPGLDGYKTILLPANEAALEVHHQLCLRLPEGFKIE